MREVEDDSADTSYNTPPVRPPVRPDWQFVRARTGNLITYKGASRSRCRIHCRWAGAGGSQPVSQRGRSRITFDLCYSECDFG